MGASQEQSFCCEHQSPHHCLEWGRGASFHPPTRNPAKSLSVSVWIIFRPSVLLALSCCLLSQVCFLSFSDRMRAIFLLYSNWGVEFDYGNDRIYDVSLFTLLARKLELLSYCFLLLYMVWISTFNILFSFCSFGCIVRYLRSWFPKGSNPCFLQWKCEVLTTGQLGKFLTSFFFFNVSFAVSFSTLGRSFITRC